MNRTRCSRLGITNTLYPMLRHASNPFIVFLWKWFQVLSYAQKTQNQPYHADGTHMHTCKATSLTTIISFFMGSRTMESKYIHDKVYNLAIGIK